MLSLKDYQQRALDALSIYFQQCSMLDDADTAFYQVTKNIYGQGIPYNNIKEVPGIPYVCIRIPTGGGKTLVACHAVGTAARDLLQKDYPLVLWLVPSNAILEQTISALRNPRHSYRQALESTVGRVNVMGVQEALSIKRTTLISETSIIVSTIQAFRVDVTEGRKVYEDSGSLMDHENEIRGKGFIEDGAVVRSLANVLNIWRPIVVVDEAHNVRTPLSFEVLARFNPSCIIEFTATPQTEEVNRSNVLHTVSAAELKAEAMIKLPIALETRPDWKELLSDAIAMRNHLEARSQIERQLSGEYIRPIMLLQAQPTYKEKDSITVEVILNCLVEDHMIPREQIAIATGKTNELDKEKDILAPDSIIRYVITVQALKEGWDCPFAYVLCSVAELRSTTAVEQMLGRIMRLPKARWKSKAELNMAYAYAASQSFAEAANALTDTLVQNGFNRQEAKDLITILPRDEGSPLFAEFTAPEPGVMVTSPETPDLKCLPAEVKEKISINEVGGISFKGVMDDSEREVIKKCFKTPGGRTAVEQIYRKSRGLKVAETAAPADRGIEFIIPVLSVKQGDMFEIFDDTHFIDMPWSLAECDALPTEAEFPKEIPAGQHGLIDVTEEGKIAAKHVSTLQREMRSLDSSFGWAVHDLVHWLDMRILHPDISSKDSALFITSLVSRLIEDRGISLEQLVHEKYRLRKAVAQKIDEHRKKAHLKAYQSLLLPDAETPLAVSPRNCFSYEPMQYPFNTQYRGSYQFKKHYYPHVGGMSTGEEVACAQFIDELDEVEFWVRNLERRPLHSFWLQTSTDKFYPDFVCKLKDGRYLVVEYKGADRWSDDDSKEKRNIGGLWEARSEGKCLFIMPKGKDLAAIKAKILQ